MHQGGKGDSEFIDGRRDVLALVFNLVELLLCAQDAGLALLPRLQVQRASVVVILVVGIGCGVGSRRGHVMISTNLR